MPTPVSSTRTRTRRFGSAAQSMRQPAALRHRLDRVLREVEEHVAQLRGVAFDQQAAVGAAARRSTRRRAAPRAGPRRARSTSSGAIATGPNFASSGRTNFRKPWMRSSSRRISCPMISTCVRRRLPRRQLLLQQLEMNGHRVERILHLVRDAGGQPADHRDAARQLGELRRLDALRATPRAAARSPDRTRRPARETPRRRADRASRRDRRGRGATGCCGSRASAAARAAPAASR